MDTFDIVIYWTPEFEAILPEYALGLDNFQTEGSFVSTPGYVWLLGSGLIGVVGFRTNSKRRDRT